MYLQVVWEYLEKFRSSSLASSTSSVEVSMLRLTRVW